MVGFRSYKDLGCLPRMKFFKAYSTYLLCESYIDGNRERIANKLFGCYEVIGIFYLYKYLYWYGLFCHS